ncbi:hypothetical protein KFK09_016977 [Dendrobium nobile]|uniref:Ubiquitin-like protease family profile domain-containing protein n=1 Tax=Dendrobium nobile TaxID=94219 RepID=A0A8T3B259_DENNO|nr:hypothetical protein KFK09_016977 [Dendrobium nobile]
MPRLVQNVPLVYKLLSCWDSKKQCFLIKDQNLQFTADEVAMILGLPNRGNNFEIGGARITGKSANDIRKEVISLDESTAMPDVLKKFIIFLLSNLFFPLHNYRTPASVISVARNVEKFLSYNWPDSIREFLVADFNAVAKKMKKGQPLGYLNGFVHIIVIWFLEHYALHEPLNSKARPRFLRWGSDVVYNDADASSLFDGLEVSHLLTSFDAITTEERDLLANPPKQTPQTSPDKVPNKEIILHTPNEHLPTPPTSPTPQSPLRQNTPPPSPVRPPPSPISPGGPSTLTLQIMCKSTGRYRSDTIYTAGNIQIFRSQIDELLTDQYLDDNHIDAFASLLVEKNKLRPGLYQPFIYVSSLHWLNMFKVILTRIHIQASTKYDMESKQYVSHINKDAVNASNFLLLPVNDSEHWTLLVAYLKKATWYFFDSLPNPMHRAVLPLVIDHLHDETQGCFQSDIRSWKVLEAEGVPTQTNGFDCGMFVCKYMENVIQLTLLNGIY